MRSILQITVAFVLIIGLTSCQPSLAPEDSKTFPLGSSTENGVEVSFALTRQEDNQFILSATFIPLEAGMYFYSKDIPQNGVEGLGRPTQLELTQDSKLTALGELTESSAAEIPATEPKDLLVYPPGEITLSFPVALPPGSCWLDEQVSVTYMACGERGCKPPVIGKIVDVRVPCANTAVDS